MAAVAGDEPVRRRIALVDALRDRPTGRVRSEAIKLLRAELRGPAGALMLPCAFALPNSNIRQAQGS